MPFRSHRSTVLPGAAKASVARPQTDHRASHNTISGRVSHYAPIVGFGILTYVLIAPLLAFVHELAVLGAARALSGVSWLIGATGVTRMLPIDPIYTSAMVLTLGGIEARGIAIAEPIGAWLDHVWPGLFEPCQLIAQDAWASAVIEPGATVISRWISALTADATLLLIGFAAISYGRRWMRQLGPGGAAAARLRCLILVGAIVQAQVIAHHLVKTPPELRELEAAGIPFAIGMIVSGDVQAGPRLAEQLGAMPEPIRDAILGLSMAATAYLLALAMFLAPASWRLLRTTARSFRRRVGRGVRPAVDPVVAGGRNHSTVSRITSHVAMRLKPVRWAWVAPRFRSTVPRRFATVGTLAVFAAAVALSPLGDLADAETRYLAFPGDGWTDSLAGEPSEASDPEPLAVVPADQPSSLQATPTSSPVSTTPQPSIVTVRGRGHRYIYQVNGVPQSIRGMGYNVQYRKLAPDDRAARLDRDFAAMRQLGVNTVFGWEPAEFDDVLLDTAHAHGLGVAPPFDLDPSADYSNPEVRNRLTAEVLAWVDRYRHHPAIRMWAIGNEVLHKLVYPSWMPVRSNPEWELQARAFASFYVELIDKVHALDPQHPVTHRDAEDAYFTWLRDAMADGRSRPWFVYGVNTYTPRLAEILAGWPANGWDVALFVSEFAPGGMSPADRPRGFRTMWQTIRSAQDRVLGGSVYAWTTDGPEEVDRVFGIVDANGAPVDGSTQAIRSMFRGQERLDVDQSRSVESSRESRLWTVARQTIRAIQDGRSRETLEPRAADSIMGDVANVAKEAPTDAEIQIAEVQDSNRLAWLKSAGLAAEWWVTWLPGSTPHRKLTFIVQEWLDGSLHVGYIYYGPR